MKKALIILAICLLTLPSLQVAFAESVDSETNEFKEENVSNSAGTDHYQNCRILVTGLCDTVEGPLTWLLGFYVPLRKVDFIIQAKGGEGEKLNVIIFGGGNFGAYYDIENIKLDIRTSSGILFWYGKSLIVDGNRILAFCNAEDIFVTT